MAAMAAQPHRPRAGRARACRPQYIQRQPRRMGRMARFMPHGAINRLRFRCLCGKKVQNDQSTYIYSLLFHACGDKPSESTRSCGSSIEPLRRQLGARSRPMDKDTRRQRLSLPHTDCDSCAPGASLTFPRYVYSDMVAHVSPMSFQKLNIPMICL